jgi:hypothetical protein
LEERYVSLLTYPVIRADADGKLLSLLAGGFVTVILSEAVHELVVLLPTISIFHTFLKISEKIKQAKF